MDKQLNILLILHFAVKMKDDMHSSEETFERTGLSQNKISQYFNGKCAMPRASRIALAQHIMKSLKVRGETYKWLDKLSTNSLHIQPVVDLISYIREHKKLSAPRGRTDAIANNIINVYESIN